MSDVKRALLVAPLFFLGSAAMSALVFLFLAVNNVAHASQGGGQTSLKQYIMDWLPFTIFWITILALATTTAFLWTNKKEEGER